MSDGYAGSIVSFRIPIITRSPNRVRGHTLYLARSNRAEMQAAYLITLAHARKQWGHDLGAMRWLVSLSRWSPGRLDGDNLQASLKYVRDGIAYALGVDDGDESRIEWSYSQHRCRRGEQGVSVVIVRRVEAPTKARKRGVERLERTR